MPILSRPRLLSPRLGSSSAAILFCGQRVYNPVIPRAFLGAGLRRWHTVGRRELRPAEEPDSLTGHAPEEMAQRTPSSWA